MRPPAPHLSLGLSPERGEKLALQAGGAVRTAAVTEAPAVSLGSGGLRLFFVTEFFEALLRGLFHAGRTGKKENTADAEDKPSRAS